MPPAPRFRYDSSQSAKTARRRSPRDIRLMSEYICVAQCSDCPPGQAIEIVANGRMIALFNVDGEYFALDGVCPHQGGPLGQGELCGAVVTCPWHGWQFDVTNGQNQITPTICQPRFTLKIEDGNVMVRADDLNEV